MTLYLCSILDELSVPQQHAATLLYEDNAITLMPGGDCESAHFLQLQRAATLIFGTLLVGQKGHSPS
jgi:hypothetical protein